MDDETEASTEGAYVQSNRVTEWRTPLSYKIYAAIKRRFK